MLIYDVFISYRRKDGSVIAENLAEYLHSMGLRVFFDKDEIKDSQDFKDRIETSLRQAPNYLLIATTAAFEFYTNQEDWVKREMEIACENYDGNSGSNRVITVVAPYNVIIPNELDLPENIRCLANPNRIMFKSELPSDDEKLRILKAVTQINRHNLWNAGHRWLEDSKESGGRFASLDINASLFPNAAKAGQKSQRRRKFPIYVRREDDSSGNGNEKVALMQALSQDTDHVYLIGQGGIGKTTTLVHIMNEAYGERQAYTETCQIPLYVALSTAPDTYGTLYEGGKSTFIRRAIYKQVREDRTLKQIRKKELGKLDEAFSVPFDTAVSPIEDLLSKITPAPEYLLLLDGLNEVSRTYIEEAGRSVIQMILREINWLMEKCPNVRVMITGRADEAMIHGDRLTRLALSGVEDDSIRQYLSACDCEEAKINRVFENDSLLETLRVPLFLVMYAYLRENDEITTQGEILHTFFNESKDTLRIYTVQDRLCQVENDVENAASAVQKMRITSEMQCFMLDFLLPEIAWYMEQRNLFALDEETIAEIIEPVLTGTADTDICGRYGKQVFDKYCIDGSAKTHTRKTAKDILSKLGSDMEEVTESFIDCCMFSLGILSANNGKYGFVHQHIRDYFASQKVVNQMWLSVCLYENEQDDMAYECLGTVLRDKPLSLTLLRFIGESLGEHKNKPQFIDGQWLYMVPEELCDRSLIRYTLDVLRGVACERDYILNNIIHILNDVRTDLSGEDLSSLDFSNCVLNRIQLSHPGLYASFHNAVVDRGTIFPEAHRGRLENICFLPGRNLLMTASFDDGTIKLWDIYTSKCVKTIEAHKNGVHFLYHHKERAVVITGGKDGIKIWDDQTFEQTGNAPIHEGSSIPSLVISPDGQYILYNACIKEETNGLSEHLIYIMDALSLECIEMVVFSKGYLRNHSLCEDKRYLIVEYCTDINSRPRVYSFALYDRELKYWIDLNEYKALGNLSVCENIGYLLIQSKERLCLFDPVLKKTIMETTADKSKIIHRYIMDDDVLCTITQNDEIRYYDIAQGKVIAKFQKVGFEPRKSAITRQESLIAAFGINKIYVYDYKNVKLLSQISTFWMRILSASFSSDNRKILTTSGNETIQLWEEDNNQYHFRSRILHVQGDFCFADWLNSSTHCMVSYITRTKLDQVLCCDVDTGKVLVKRDFTRLRDIVYSNDGRFAYVERRIQNTEPKMSIIELYDTETLEQLDSWEFIGNYALECVSPDNKYFIMSYNKNRTTEKHVAHVFSIKNSDIIKEIICDEYISLYRYSPDGNSIIAIGEEKTHEEIMYIYDSYTFEVQRMILDNKYISHTFDIRPDCKQIACTGNCTVYILNWHTKELLKTLQHSERWVTIVKYSPDGTRLLSVTENGTIYIWDTDTYECLQTIPNIPGLFIQGVDFRNLAPGSNFTEEDKRILRLYGALID